jgi:ubiquitin-like protein Pup
MSSQQFQPRPVSQDQHVISPNENLSSRVDAARDAYDAILDEIDAEAFVKGFVQKGGQ